MRLGLALIALAGCPGPGPQGVITEPVDLSSRPSMIGPDEARTIEIISGNCEVRTEGEVAARTKLPIYATVLDAEQEKQAIGSFHYTSGVFTLATGTSSVAGVELSGWGVTVRAIAKARDIPLWVRPSRKLLHGMLTPGPKTRVELQAVEERAARVRLKHSLVDAADLEAEELIPCEDLTATASSPERLTFGKPVTLVSKKPIELRATRGDADATARIVLRSPSMAATEVETAGGFSRVEIRSADGDLSGWVSSSVVSARDGAFPPDAPEPVAIEPRSTVAWTCKNPVRLAVPYGDMLWIGSLRNGADVVGSSKRSEMEPPSSWLKLEVLALPGVSVYVRRADLDRCN